MLRSVRNLCLTLLVISITGAGFFYNNRRDHIDIDPAMRNKAAQVLDKTDKKPINSVGTGIVVGTHQKLKGVAYGIYDGDTCWITLPDNKKEKLRLAYIDAPEKNQQFGLESQKFLSNMIDGREITAFVEDIDRYGRKVVRIFYDGHDVNAEMVRNGYAWHYKKFSKPDSIIYKEFDRLEQTARSERLGLWAYSSAEPPWEYRKREQR